jgi:DNA-binding CsgD family transcriptional regulator
MAITMPSVTMPSVIIDNYCDRLRARFSPCAVAVVAAGPHGGRTPVSNKGYPDSVINYLTHDFVRRDPGYRLVRARPSQFVCWDDVPQYRKNEAARYVFQPAGFVQGTTKILGLDDGVVGELHVNLQRPEFTSEMADDISGHVAMISTLVKAHRDRERLKVSPRKIKILELLAAGYSSREIASELFISPRTVDTHITQLMVALDRKNRLQTVVRAIQLGVIDLHIPSAAAR